MYELTNTNLAQDEQELSSIRLMNLIQSGEKQQQSGSEPAEVITSPQLDHFVSDHENTIRQSEIPQTVTHIPEEELDWNAPFNPKARIPFWLRPFAKKSIGLEINSRFIRASKVRRLGKKIEILRMEELDLTSGKSNDEMILSQYLKELARDLRFSSGNVVSLIGGMDVNLRLLKMPKVAKKEIHDALLWKNKKELHFFNDAPSVLHYVILDDAVSANANEFFVLVIAVKEELVSHHLNLLKRANIVPSKLIIKSVAQWNLIKEIPGKGLNSMMIDIGYESSHITFYRDHTLQFAREIPIGGNHFTTSLMQTIFVDNVSYVLTWDEAEAIKQQMGLMIEPIEGKTVQGIPYSEIAVMMRPVAERLVSEIKMSLDYYLENFKSVKFDAIFINGNAIRLKHLKHFLEEQIGQPVQIVHAQQAIGDAAPKKNKDKNFISFFDSAGAAISHGADFNFLPEPMKKEIRYRHGASWLSNALFLVCMILGGTTFLMNKKHDGLRGVDATLTASLRQIQDENSEFDKLVSEQTRLKTIENQLRAEVKTDSLVSLMLKMISHVTPEEIVIDEMTWGNAFNEFQLNRLKVNQQIKANGNNAANKIESDELHIKGIVYKDVFYADIHLLNFISSIEKTNFFSEVTLREKRRDPKDERLYFEVVAKKGLN